jgi:RNA polymerase sigma-70 factor, ECF subfamily
VQRVSDLEVRSEDGLDERDLTLAFQAGDASSYNEIYRRYRPMVDRICRRMLGNYHDAEEAAQEAFLRVYQGLPQFNGRYHLRSWVVRVATNTCLDLIRRRARRPQEFEAPDEIPNGNGNGNGNGHHNDDPLEVIISENESDDVRRVLDLLPPHYRAALILREYEGLSYEEIGQALDLNASQIKFLLHRAKKRFRKTYKGAFGNGFFAHPIWILWWLVFGRRAARQGGVAETTSSLASGTPSAAHTIVPASSTPLAALTQASVPVVEAAAPMVQASAPIVQAAAPIVQAVAPMVQVVTPVVQAAAPVIHTAHAMASIGGRAVAAVAALAISGAGAVSAIVPKSSQPATPPSPSSAAVQTASAPGSTPSKSAAPAPAASPSASPAAQPSSSTTTAASPSSSPSSEPSSSASPSPEATASPAPSSTSGAAAGEPSDFSMTFSSDRSSASPCGCGQQPTVAAEQVDADNKGVNDFSQRVENAAATDASGQAAWPMWLEQSSADGSTHVVSFGLTDEQGEYRYAAQGQRVSRERFQNGAWRYTYIGTYAIQTDQADNPSSVPAHGTYRAEIVFSWRQDRIMNTAFVLHEQT